MIFWVRFGAILLLVALHLSSIQIFTSASLPPVVLIASAVAWTALMGFPGVLLPLIFLVIATDSILFGQIVGVSVYILMVAYATVFVMKRTLLGDRTNVSFWILMIFSGLMSAGWSLFILAIELIGGKMDTVWLVVSGKTFFLGGVMGVLVYPVIFFLLSTCEQIIRELRQDSLFSLK